MSNLNDVAIEELARLLNVWLEHDLVATTEAALTDWALQTAARSPRLPRPDLALPLLSRLGLRTPTRRGALRPSDYLLARARAASREIDRLAPPLAICIFERMLALPHYSGALTGVLSHVRLRRRRLTLPWKEVPRNERENRAWLWLQQLGLMRHDGAEVEFDSALLPYVADTPPARRPVSQAELDERLELQRVRSALAEDYVVDLEKRRLHAAGAGHLAKDVVRISTDDVTAGYDILSFDGSGARRLVEVKSSAGPRSFFVLSRNEYDTARLKRGAYWLAWVGYSAHLPGGPCEVAWFQDPLAVLEGNPSPWTLAEGDLLIRGSNSDAEYQSQP